MNNIEREVITLNSALKMIDGMVNWSMFVKFSEEDMSNVLFETRAHSRLFLILLGDFLSSIGSDKKEKVPPLGFLPVPSGGRKSDLTFLFHLRQVCADPKLGSEVGGLRLSVEAFADWLEGEFDVVGVNLPDIDVVADVRITRLRYLKMCGDIAKHNLPRLSVNVGHLRKILAASGHLVSEQQAYLAVDNFAEWFQDDIFLYHSSLIAEFLNNIRWGIYDYVQPEFRRAFYFTDKAIDGLPIYGYRMPEDVSQPLARAMYWDLMNKSRHKPHMPRFVISDVFRMRY